GGRGYAGTPDRPLLRVHRALQSARLRARAVWRASAWCTGRRACRAGCALRARRRGSGCTPRPPGRRGRGKDAEDGAEVGDEAVAGAAGDQPVPDLVERVERGGLQPEVVDAAPAEHRRLAVGFGVSLDLEDVQFGGRADAEEGEPDGTVELLQV